MQLAHDPPIDFGAPANRLITGRSRQHAGQLEPDVLARATGYHPVGRRIEIDRWIMSQLHETVASVVKMMDAYDNYG
ncbi:MAG: hypothetical protein R6U98_34120, partial [Pirellulaceae bacterium]